MSRDDADEVPDYQDWVSVREFSALYYYSSRHSYLSVEGDNEIPNEIMSSFRSP